MSLRVSYDIFVIIYPYHRFIHSNIVPTGSGVCLSWRTSSVDLWDNSWPLFILECFCSSFGYNPWKNCHKSRGLSQPEFRIGFTEFSITLTSASQFISQILMNNVTTEINGSTIYCSEDGDENGAQVIAINVINKGIIKLGLENDNYKYKVVSHNPQMKL